MTEAEETCPTNEDVPMIVYREPYVDKNGVQCYREHIVPVAKWAEYEKEHGL